MINVLLRIVFLAILIAILPVGRAVAQAPQFNKVFSRDEQNIHDLYTSGSEYYWLNDDELVLTVYDPDELSKQLTEAKPGKIIYGFGTKERVIKWNTRSGEIIVIADDASLSCSEDGNILYEQKKPGGSQSFYGNIGSARPVDRNNEEGYASYCPNKKNSRDFESAISTYGKGGVYRTEYGTITRYPGSPGTTEYLPKGSNTPIAIEGVEGLSVGWSMRLTGIQHYAFKGAFLMAGTDTSRNGEVNLSWLYDDGRIEGIPKPMVLPREIGPFGYYPYQKKYGATRSGIVMLLMATKDYGLRLIGPDKFIELAKYVNPFLVSPDGCKIAFTYQQVDAPPEENFPYIHKIRVGNVCRPEFDFGSGRTQGKNRDKVPSHEDVGSLAARPGAISFGFVTLQPPHDWKAERLGGGKFFLSKAGMAAGNQDFITAEACRDGSKDCEASCDDSVVKKKIFQNAPTEMTKQRDGSKLFIAKTEDRGSAMTLGYFCKPSGSVFIGARSVVDANTALRWFREVAETIEWVN